MTSAEAFALLRGEGQPWLFVNLAVTLASGSDDVRLLLSWMTRRSKPRRSPPPPPPIPLWLPFYRSHRAIQAGIGSGMGLPTDYSNELLDDLRAIRHVTSEELKEEVAEIGEANFETFVRMFVGIPFPPDDATLRVMLAAETGNTAAPGEDDVIDSLLISPAGQFYFRVWLPCWILYREYPPRLLRRARGGDLDALEKLLRLDKTVIHDPRIAERVHQLTHAGAKRDRDQILDAIQGKPKGRLDAKGMRYGVAGLISQLAIVFHTRVTASEIAALFDAIERVRTGQLTDTRIATGETFAKAVQRNRTWPLLPRR